MSRSKLEGVRVVKGTKSLGRKQRKMFQEFWDANEEILKARKFRKVDAVAIWLDGFTYGKHGLKWER